MTLTDDVVPVADQDCIGGTSATHDQDIVLDVDQEVNRSEEDHPILHKPFHMKLKSIVHKNSIDLLPSVQDIVNSDLFAEASTKAPEQMKEIDNTLDIEDHDRKFSTFHRVVNFLLREYKWPKRARLHKTPRRAEKLYHDMRSDERRDVRWLLMDLAYAFSIYGAAAQVVEYNLMIVSLYYGLKGYYSATPSGIWLNFDPQNDVILHDKEYKDYEDPSIKMPKCRQFLRSPHGPIRRRSLDLPSFSEETNYSEYDTHTSNHFIKLGKTELDVGKLSELHDMVEEILQGKIPTALDARRRVESIVIRPSAYSHPLFEFTSCIIMTCVGVAFLGGTSGEIIAGLIAGLIVGIWKTICSRIGKIGNNLIPLSSTLIAGGIGLIAKSIFEYNLGWYTVDVLLVVMAGIFTVLPGMEFVTAISELNMSNMLAGIVRLITVLVTVIQLGFGMLVSGRISGLIFGPDVSMDRQGTPQWLIALILPLFSFCSMIDLHIPLLPLTVLFVLAASYLGFFGGSSLTNVVGWEIGTLVAAFGVGVLSNIFSWITKRSNMIVSACGILLLIPGIISDNEVRSMLENDQSLGIQAIMQSLMISFALAVGLMFSDFLMFFTEEWC
jgi:uncharacterized membrane protein YjjP (DUF1212 family)